MPTFFLNAVALLGHAKGPGRNPLQRNATRAETVTYRIHHTGGSSDRVVNQQQPSAGWYHLGAFAMAPGQNHRVEAYGALEGETVADAIRFVSAGVGAPGISYVHANHLGSPQKMTDASKSVVWDAVYTPFGQVHSITGTVTNNLRFPGQYADAETGYSYNYFRDYDPTTGRYVESDPIGLRGGFNTYNYVDNKPLRFIDPLGLVNTRNNRLAPYNMNTIVCDGSDGVRTQLSPNMSSKRRRCGVRDCQQVHENLHLDYALQTSPNVCHGKADGILVEPDTRKEQAEQESLGYGAELGCLLRKLKNAPCECKKVLEDEIAGVGQKQDSYRGRF